MITDYNPPSYNIPESIKVCDGKNSCKLLIKDLENFFKKTDEINIKDYNVFL